LSTVCTNPGYIYYRDVCFKLSTEDKTWQGAKLDCELTGGWLISLDSPEKLSTVNSILKTYGMSIKQILADYRL